MSSLFDPTLQVHITCYEPEDFQEKATAWDLDHLQLVPGNYQVNVEIIHTRNIQLSNVTHHIGVLERGGVPQNAWVVCLPVLLGSNPLYYCSRMLGKDECPVMLSGQEFETRSSGSVCYVTLVIKADLLNREAVLLTGHPFAFLVRQNRVCIRQPDQRRLVQMVKTSMSTLKNHRQNLHLLAVQEELLEKQLVEQLLLSIYVPSGEKTKTPKRRVVACKAEQVIRKHLPQKLSIEQICSLLGCSARILHLGFRERYGTTPGKYTQIMALNAVRRKLCCLPSDKTITEVAMDFGFYHLGRFSQQYKDLFVELPSITVARSREQNY